MQIINVTFYPKKAKEQEFIQLLKRMVELAKSEEGCIQYDLGKDLFTEGKYLLVEQWELAAHHAAHLKTAHFLDFVAKIDGFLTDKQELNMTVNE